MISKRTLQVGENLTKLKDNSWLLLDKFPSESRENFSWRKSLLDTYQVKAFLCRKTAIRRILNLSKEEKLGNMVLLGNIENLLLIAGDKRYNKLMVQGSSRITRLFPPYNLGTIQLRGLVITTLISKVFFIHLLHLVDNLKSSKSS